MNLNRLRLLVGCAAAGLLACKGAEKPTAMPITAKILLRYHPPAGSVYRYVIEGSSRFGPDSNGADTLGRNTLTLAFSQTIGTPGAEGVPVTTTLDSGRVASPILNPASAADASRRLRGARLTAVYDSLLRPVRSDFTGLNSLPGIVSDQVQLGFRAAAHPLPEQPVGPGDSWINTVELPVGQLAAGAPVTTTTKLTVREITVTRGDTTVRLVVEMSLPDRPLRFNAAGQSITVALRGAIGGEQLFSLTRGAIVNSSLGGTMRATVSGGFFGPQGMTVRIDQEGSMRLVEGGGAARP